MAYWDTLGKSDEWYTPKHVFDALGCTFDLDVAHPRDATTFVPAREYIYQGSLSAEWNGFVWMNPPFGGRNGLAPWLDKFFQHGDGIALVPDRTSAPWFRDAWGRAHLVLFTPKLRFHRPDGTVGKSPSNGTALIGVGHIAQAKRREARDLGIRKPATLESAGFKPAAPQKKASTTGPKVEALRALGPSALSRQYRGTI